MRALDLNCDVGESFGNFCFGADEQIMPFLTSANIACGFHSGDPVVMENTVALAKKHGVALGIHWGLPDVVGFGRRRMDISAAEAKAMALYQMGALSAFARAADATIDHLVPHGALFAMLATDDVLAAATIDAVLAFDPGLALFWPTPLQRHRLYQRAEEANVPVVREFAVDLGYRSDGSLVIERVKQPVDLRKLRDRLTRFINQGVLETVDGDTISFEFDALLMHGDSPNAGEVAATCREVMAECGIAARPATAILAERAARMPLQSAVVGKSQAGEARQARRNDQ